VAATVLVSRSAGDVRLRELGLSRAGLISAVRAAAAAVAGCTIDSPPIARGWLAWHDAVVRLRQEFRPLGWEGDDTANFATIMDEAAGIKVAVVNTDDGAGDPASYPINRSRRGEYSKLAIETNQLQLPFMGEPDEAKSASVSTWYLCIHVVGEVVRAELSLPTKCEGGIIGGWKERIIIVGRDDDLRVRGPSDFDYGPEFEVRISRK
jgi:hypothetical protein